MRIPWWTDVHGMGGPVMPCRGSWLNRHLDDPAIESKRNQRTGLAMKFTAPVLAARFLQIGMHPGFQSLLSGSFVVMMLLAAVAFVASYDMVQRRHILYITFFWSSIQSVLLATYLRLKRTFEFAAQGAKLHSME